MSKPQNLEAKRALKAFTFAEIGNKKQKDTKNKFNYSAAVQELPSMIRMNGLRAAMAFFYSKEGQHRMVFENVRDWFNDEDEPTKFMRAKLQASPENQEPAGFMKILLELSDDEYRIAQAEVLKLANWMIRFVKTDNANTSSTKTTTDDTGQPQT